MTLDDSRPLRELRADFLRTSTQSMPLAGLIVWSALGIAAPMLSASMVGMLALYVMAMIMPLAFLLERMRGRNLFAKNTNPLMTLFFASIAGIGVTVPVIVTGANLAHEPTLVVLGMGILAGVIWIPYGWAAGDPVGLRHAIARAVGCYAAYALAPTPYRAPAICAVVAVAYVYSLLFMKKPQHAALAVS